MFLLLFNLNKTPISGPGSLSHHSFPISSLSTYLEMIKQAVFWGRGGHSLHAFNVNNDWSMYQKQLWPFPATLKQRYASLGLFSWCAGYCCLFVTILSPCQQIGDFHPIKLVIVTSLWCWLIWWLYWPIDSNLKKHVYWLWTEFKHIDCYDCMRTNRVQPCNSLTLDLNRWVEWKTVCSWERWVEKIW